MPKMSRPKKATFPACSCTRTLRKNFGLHLKNLTQSSTRVARARLRLRLAAGDGSVQERTVRVLAVESGRARLADLDRQTELTAALHRIVSVEPDPAVPFVR